MSVISEFPRQKSYARTTVNQLPTPSLASHDGGERKLGISQLAPACLLACLFECIPGKYPVFCRILRFLSDFAQCTVWGKSYHRLIVLAVECLAHQWSKPTSQLATDHESEKFCILRYIKDFCAS